MGKTSYGLGMDRPQNILMIDCEDKGELMATAENFKVGAYFQPLTDVANALGSKFHVQAVYDRIVQIVEKCPKDRFTTLLIDNAASLQTGAGMFIEANASDSKRYGVRPDNAVGGGYGGAWPGVKYLMAGLLHAANSKGIQAVVATFQLTPAWKDGRPLFNKFKTTDVTMWHERSILTLVMVEPMVQNFPVPRALVLKEQLPKIEWVETEDGKGFKRQSRRLPAALPKAEPSAVYNYLDNPANFSEPALGETVTATELDPYTVSFKSEQLVQWERILRLQKELGVQEESSGE